MTFCLQFQQTSSIHLLLPISILPESPLLKISPANDYLKSYVLATPFSPFTMSLLLMTSHIYKPKLPTTLNRATLSFCWEREECITSLNNSLTPTAHNLPPQSFMLFFIFFKNHCILMVSICIIIESLKKTYNKALYSLNKTKRKKGISMKKTLLATITLLMITAPSVNAYYNDNDYRPHTLPGRTVD